jgi:hypothetical protein
MTQDQQTRPKRGRSPIPQSSATSYICTYVLTQQVVWASLITNLSYLPGLLTLHHSLNHPTPDPHASPSAKQGTKYPFVALYTSSFPPEGLKVLRARGITAQWVPSVRPAITIDYAQDPRFAETWNKLIVYSLEEYERIVLLDGDILVRRNMDELMDIPLDGEEDGERVFAAAHACACNPLKKAHYPATWYVVTSRLDFVFLSTMALSCSSAKYQYH